MLEKHVKKMFDLCLENHQILTNWKSKDHVCQATNKFCFLADIKNIQIRSNQKAISAKSTAMKRVISEIQKHYKKAGIDLKSVKSLKYDINKLYNNYRIMTSIVY